MRDDGATGDVVLDAALVVAAAHEGKKPAAVIRPLGKGLRNTLYARLD